MKTEIELRDLLLKLSNNDIDFAKGVMTNTQTKKCRQEMIELIKEHPDITCNRISLMSVAFGEFERKNGLR